MRKNIVAGLACALLALPACPADTGTTTESNTVATTDDTTGAMTGGMTGGMTDEPTAGTTAPTTTAGAESLMEDFGMPCTDHSDCVEALGPDGQCLTDILGLYNLPGGYCSLLCALPDGMTAYVEDDAICGDGVTCIGAMGYFEGCVRECTDNSQCPRDGYECRLMPQIGSEGDPKFCLMTDDNMV